MIKLGITGGIGSGKSYISNLLRQRGIAVYDTDTEAKRLMASHVDIQRELVSLLGEEVYCEGGGLNKPLLIQYLFSDTSHAEKINSIVHPRVKEDFSCWLGGHSDCEIVAMECAILFESGFAGLVDYTGMVYAPLDVRIARVMHRDGVTKKQVCERIAAQMSDDEKCLLADFVFVNDGERDVISQVESLIYSLKAGKAVR